MGNHLKINLEGIEEKEREEEKFNEMGKKFVAQLEIATFFEQNPYAMDTADNLSRQIRRELSVCGPIFDSLINKGILEKMGEGDSAILSLINFESNQTQNFFENSKKLLGWINRTKTDRQVK